MVAGPLTHQGSAVHRRIALVTHGFEVGAGVPTVARWLRDSLHSAGGYSVDVHDLATSSRDGLSRRLVVPSSWVRSSLRDRSVADDSVTHWGANAVEIETMRYRQRRELTRLLKDYHIIHVVSGTPAWANAVIGTGVPTVLQPFTSVAWERERSLTEQVGLGGLWHRGMTFLTHRIELRALREVDAVLAPNAAMLEYARSSGQRRLVKAVSGVDADRFSPPATGWQCDGYLLSVCRLGDPRKGLERMMRAYASMLEIDAAATPPLVIAGKGKLAGPVRALIGDLGLHSRVTVQSDVAPSDLVELYRGASVFLQTSYEEGLGVSVLEAMACGVPVVATETAGTTETVVNGVTGWLVTQAPGTDVPRLFARRVLDTLERDGRAMGARARVRCLETFSRDATLRVFTDLYEELTEPLWTPGGV